MRRNVFTIAPGAPFLETFVEAFLAGEIVASVSRASPPLAMARATIYVPTQRAGRALAAQFARAYDRGATLLPRILPLGGLEESETAALFGGAEDFDDALPAPIEELERRLLLAQLVMQWSKAIGRAILSIDPTGAPVLDETEPLLVASSPSGAYALAADLGALIDEFIIEDVAPEAIDRIVDDSFDKYWSITTQFLRIALHQWPDILSERGRIDAASRQKILLEAQVAALAQQKHGGPVIALGSTGAHPTTARLLAAIAALENGAVILPGLDREMSPDAWARVGESDDEPAFSHPQTMLKRLLNVMGVHREDVCELGKVSPELSGRRALVAEAMLPAIETSAWRLFRASHGASFVSALEDVSAIEAPDERMEALALALFMREALETPQRTAALVTPDRNLARRVAAELRRFDIEIDDSGGASLASTSEGVLARLVAEIGAEGFSAVNVAALLAHPLALLGHAREKVAALAPLVEIGVLRELGAGQHGLSASVAKAREFAGARHAHPAAHRISDDEWRDIEALLRQLEAAFATYVSLRGENALSTWAQAHRAAFEALTQGASEADDGAQALFGLFDRLIAAEAPPGFDALSYASLFDRISFETTLRGPRRAHPRLKILGPLEARLIEADLVLIGGLDEGVWPPQTDTGAFLNRSMRRQLDLSPPERRIGQSAHDFVMALGAQSVVLSRAVKRGGSPTVASRFLTRLEALAGDAFAGCKARGDRMLAIAAALDHPRDYVTIARPAPRPPIDLRPTKLSVTRVERLRRDPYAIYAEYVLKLVPLAPLGAEIGARERGTALHEALAEFVMRHPRGPLPPDARAQLHDMARRKLSDFFLDPAFATFTWPRIAQGLDHALDFEQERRSEGCEIFIETRGAWRLPLEDGSTFTLTAVADRIEVDPHGRAYVFDYKTGAPPSVKQVGAGWAPQLTLEAAMVEAGAFADVGVHPVGGAAYVGLKDGGDTQWLNWKDRGFADVVATHRVEVEKMLSQYRASATPYPSRPFVAFVSGVGDYDHLARVKEWSRGGGDGA